MPLTMVKRLEFDAAHRLLNHESKCRNVHGHRYAVEVHLTLLSSSSLDEAGRIVDFGDVKEKLGGWIDAYLDHAYIANASDPLLPALIEQRMKVCQVPFETSAENLAVFLLVQARKVLDLPNARVSKLVLFETPTSSVEAT